MEVAASTHTKNHRARRDSGDESGSAFEDVRHNLDRLTDELWDRMYPGEIRELSAMHWTPIAMVRAVIDELQPQPHDHLLDLGSGVGKFCLAASFLCDAAITGVEQRGKFHRTALWVAKHLQPPRPVEFLCQDAFDLDWQRFSMIYLYNPFQEHQQNRGAPAIDHTIPLSDQVYDEIMARMQLRLAGLKPGTRIACLHGWGGSFPASYKLLEPKTRQPAIEVWQQCG
ncbi:MAG: class I SAM-dependent methyltransferase [Desulfobacterales bacterium]|nr:class I SAM-dependent methyltransferase [Desulfobacterales bacterium]